MVILVVDGQGGGVGKTVVGELKTALLGLNTTILAAGTNTVATNAMLRAGADAAATGENAVVYNAGRADIIVGSLGIVAANSMMGELSPAMATAISASPAVKVLIPNNKCRLLVSGVADEPIQDRIAKAVQMVKDIVQGKNQKE